MLRVLESNPGQVNFFTHLTSASLPFPSSLLEYVVEGLETTYDWFLTRQFFDNFRRLSDVLKWKRPPKRTVGRKSKYASPDEPSANSPFDVLDAQARIGGAVSIPIPPPSKTLTGRPSSSKGKSASGKIYNSTTH